MPCVQPQLDPEGNMHLHEAENFGQSPLCAVFWDCRREIGIRAKLVVNNHRLSKFKTLEGTIMD